jgi:hypothetical protein
MATPNVQLHKVTLSFSSLHELSAFKKECACGDFYIDRDELTLVGSFSEQQLKIATGKYRALYYIDDN